MKKTSQDSRTFTVQRFACLTPDVQTEEKVLPQEDRDHEVVEDLQLVRRRALAPEVDPEGEV